jgi:hypothetical protein
MNMPPTVNRIQVIHFLATHYTYWNTLTHTVRNHLKNVGSEVLGKTTTNINKVHDYIRGCTQKFPDWPPGARTANSISLSHQIQLYRNFVSQYSEFCRHNPLCCFSTSVYFCKRIFCYRLSLETFGYTLIALPKMLPIVCFPNTEQKSTLNIFSPTSRTLVR